MHERKSNRFNSKLRLKLCTELYKETQDAVQVCLDAEIIYEWVRYAKNPLVKSMGQDGVSSKDKP